MARDSACCAERSSGESLRLRARALHVARLVKGAAEGNARGNYEKMKGHHKDGTSNAARSTGINPKDREPIDPSMPNLSPG